MSTILHGRPMGKVGRNMVNTQKHREGERITLNHNMTVLAKSRTLHGKSKRGTGAGLGIVIRRARREVRGGSTCSKV